MCKHTNVSVATSTAGTGRAILTCNLCGATRIAPGGKWQEPKEALKSPHYDWSHDGTDGGNEG